MKKDEKQTNPHKTTQKLRTVHAAEKKDLTWTHIDSRSVFEHHHVVAVVKAENTYFKSLIMEPGYADLATRSLKVYTRFVSTSK